MSDWSTEIRFVDCYGGINLPEPIVRFDDATTMTVLAIVRAEPGSILYDGRNAHVSRPRIDPIRRKIIFYIELYDQVEK